MRVFLDVGAHEGQTLQEVVKRAYGFDRIYAFEPMPVQFARLESRFGGDPRVTLCNFGLADRTAVMSVYGTNDGMEASIFPTKRDLDPSVATVCEFVAASDFFLANLTILDTVVVKLNCEGAEVPILNDLIDSGQVWKVDNVMVDFDVRKITGMEGEEARILERFGKIGFDRFSLCEDVMHGPTHQERIAAWLESLTVFA